MDRTVAVRIVALYGPAMLVVLPWAMRSPSRSRAASALVASLWNFPALLLVNILAIRAGWWTFAPPSASLMGVPSDLLIGWTLLWGAAPVLLLARLHLPVVVALLALLDLALMPLAAPVVTLGSSWLVGEGVALMVALLPSQLLARWTDDNRRPEIRAALQVLMFSAAVLWVLPALIFEHASGTWGALAHWNRFGGLALQLAALPALLGVSAVQEFATRGRGTPIPYDPPRRLVTTGPYAYVANPMQVSTALVLVAWGAILWNAWVAMAGVMSVVYSLGLADGDERSDLGERFGAPWRSYRRAVTNWIPRWRPYHASANGERNALPARLYVAGSCDKCSEVARWFMARQPTGLEIVPAEAHPNRDLNRITYDPGDGGGDQQGVAAVGRALEHIHFGWAMVGFLMRLPGLAQVLQLLVDASGGEPRIVRRTESCQTAT